MLVSGSFFKLVVRVSFFFYLTLMSAEFGGVFLGEKQKTVIVVESKKTAPKPKKQPKKKASKSKAITLIY